MMRISEPPHYGAAVISESVAAEKVECGAVTDATLPAAAAPMVVPGRRTRHSAGPHEPETFSSDRAADQLAAAHRPPRARRSALSALSRDRICAGIARLPGRFRHLAVHDVPAGDHPVQSLGVRLGCARSI